MRHSLPVLLAALALGSSCSPPPEAPLPPNIVLLLADDLGFGDLGCYGSEVLRTPRIDGLAAEGMRFLDFQAQASVCAPSRASLLTGCYPQRCGVPMGLSPQREEHRYLGLHPDEVTIAELLKEAGYATACIGKWHLGGDPVFHPLNQGFDEYFGLLYNHLQSPALLDGRRVVERETDLATLTERYTRRAIEFLTEHREEPFFLFLSHAAPHRPCVPHPDFAGTSGCGAYGDVVEELDQRTGELLAALAALGLEENTLVIFTSDNGPAPEAMDACGSNGPYRGGKFTSWEGGHRVPFLVRRPGKISPGSECTALAGMIDLLPTLASMARVSPPADRRLDGRDLTPLFDGSSTTSLHETILYYNDTSLQAVRQGEWKLHLPREPETCPWWQAMGGGTELASPMLVRLDQDPGEDCDLSATRPEVVRLLQEAAEAARAELGDHDRPGAGQRPTGDSRVLSRKN